METNEVPMMKITKIYKSAGHHVVKFDDGGSVTLMGFGRSTGEYLLAQARRRVLALEAILNDEYLKP